MSTAAAPLSLLMRARRVLDRLAVYLPLVLMAFMAMTSYWLVRNTPRLGEAELESAPRHEPDYYMRDFSVKVFSADGKLKSEIVGTEGRHYPDTDTLEIDQPRIRILAADGGVTLAKGARGLINADGSEAQLFDNAVVVREARVTAQGLAVPRSEMQSDFLHFFANTEQVKSHLPVVMIRGSGDRFTGDGMGFDNLGRTMEINGRVRGVLQPRKDKDQK
jgi:lipopolysaccharide export system protein LptC